MTEAEWLASDSPDAMRGYLQEAASERKLRLFAVACCRRIWNFIPVPEAKRCVEVAELYAEGLADDSDLAEAIQASIDACNQDSRLRSETSNPWGWIEQHVHNAVSRVHRSERGGRCTAHRAAASAWGVAKLLGEPLPEGEAPDMAKGLESLEQQEFGQQAVLFRDLFGNPFRDATFDTCWVSPAVALLAQTAYDERTLPSGLLDPARLAVLSDALEEAGCANADLLSHLRSPGPHVRGCWALDLILGKE